MPTTQAKRKGPTPEEITKQQKEDAEALRRQKASVPAKAAPPTPPVSATVDDRTPAEVYADEICPTSVVGQLIKFDGKIGKYTIIETGEDITNAQLVAVMDETMTGYIRFNGEGQPPDRIQGQPYKGWSKPERKTLGDDDPGQWPVNNFGKQEDPWQQQINIVLLDPATFAFYTFATTNKTGRSGAGALMHHYDRMLRYGDAASFPIVRLTPSGYTDKRFGYVNKPVFAIMGKTPKNATAVPDTGIAKDMDDGIPF
jgi:hypothetical protein